MRLLRLYNGTIFFFLSEIYSVRQYAYSEIIAQKNASEKKERILIGTTFSGEGFTRSNHIGASTRSIAVFLNFIHGFLLLLKVLIVFSFIEYHIDLKKLMT